MSRDHSIECPKCGEYYGGMNAEDESHECQPVANERLIASMPLPRAKPNIVIDTVPCDCDALRAELHNCKMELSDVRTERDSACEELRYLRTIPGKAQEMVRLRAELERLKGDKSVKWHHEWLASQETVATLRAELNECMDLYTRTIRERNEAQREAAFHKVMQAHRETLDKLK